VLRETCRNETSKRKFKKTLGAKDMTESKERRERKEEQYRMSEQSMGGK
jgi:hypothetical protein